MVKEAVMPKRPMQLDKRMREGCDCWKPENERFLK